MIQSLEKESVLTVTGLNFPNQQEDFDPLGDMQGIRQQGHPAVSR